MAEIPFDMSFFYAKMTWSWHGPCYPSSFCARPLGGVCVLLEKNRLPKRK